jgi:hypothetical protein
MLKKCPGRGGIQTATTAKERRTILREASNSTITPKKIKEAIESATTLKSITIAPPPIFQIFSLNL